MYKRTKRKRVYKIRALVQSIQRQYGNPFQFFRRPKPIQKIIKAKEKLYSNKK
jgi:hypothetical protein